MVPRNKLKIIAAAVVSLVFIGVSVWYTQFRTSDDLGLNIPSEASEINLELVRGVQSDDHIRGNPEAKLVYIVYSDFGCPFCNDFHETLSQIMVKYGRDGDVAWVFRHMPLVQLHPQANVYALASECVAENGGNQAFWKFADLLFEKKEPTSEVSASELVALAKESGVVEDSFTSCMKSDKLQERISEDFKEAIAAGADGSPFTVIVTDRERVTFGGARKFAALSGATEALLRALGVTTIAEPDAADSASKQFTNELRTTPPTAATPAATTSAPQSTTTAQ